jgi:hypothetical protein
VRRARHGVGLPPRLPPAGPASRLGPVVGPASAGDPRRVGEALSRSGFACLPRRLPMASSRTHARRLGQPAYRLPPLSQGAAPIWG